MRCPTCGTENTPDSRFCGGCGAKLTPEQSRVAPTAKIPDDAPFPGQRSQTPVPGPSYAAPTSLAPPTYSPASIPPTNNPASIPPQNNPASIPPQNTYQAAPQYNSGPASIPPNTYQARPASIPPTNNGPASIPPGVYQAPARGEPSMSMPMVPRPRWGLIILVLLMDIGLATAGAIMLAKGLAKADAEPAPTAKPTATTSAETAPPPAPPSRAPVANTAATPPLGASLDAIAKTAPPADDAKADDNKKPPAQAQKPKVVKPAGSAAAPQDPYDEKRGLGAEIELAAARSRGDFDQCYQAAQASMQMKSRIDIGFTILPDGTVGKVHVVANSTGVPALAACLSSAIEHWAFAERPAKPTEFVRPFIYN